MCRFRPSLVPKAAEAILSGAVLGLKLQPYEAHLPFLLQFKIDMNLYGMSHIRCRAVQFRRDPPTEIPCSAAHGWDHKLTQPPTSASQVASDNKARPLRCRQVTIASVLFVAIGHPVCELQGQSSLGADHRPWLSCNTPYSWTAMAKGGGVPQPESSCALEADCTINAILNRKAVVRVPLSMAGSSQRMVESLASVWQEERSRIGSEPPPPPASPKRTPRDVCSAVSAARVDFQAVFSQVCCHPTRPSGHHGAHLEYHCTEAEGVRFLNRQMPRIVL